MAESLARCLKLHGIIGFMTHAGLRKLRGRNRFTWLPASLVILGAFSVRANEPDAAAHGPALAGGPVALCRIEDPALVELCHRALDPIAADDDVALLAVLSDDARFARPGAAGEPVVADGVDAIRDEIADAGGPRGLVNLEDTDRVVGRLIEDCRSCDKASVTVGATTCSGSVHVELLLAQPARARRITMRSTPRE